MKRVLYLILIPFFSIQINACNTSTSQEQSSSTKSDEGKIEVYYFHFTRRCATCNAVEEVTKNCLNEAYAQKVNDGEITFLSVNLEEEGNKALAEKMQVSAQTLLLVYGDQKVDLTNEGFMNAKANPEKLKTIIKETIDSFLSE